MLRSGLQKQAGAAASAVCGGVCERGGERGDDGGMRMRNAKCEMQMRRMEGAIGGLRGGGGGGGGACACESAKRHANAACESADMPRRHAKHAGMQMRRGGA